MTTRTLYDYIADDMVARLDTELTNILQSENRDKALSTIADSFVPPRGSTLLGALSGDDAFTTGEDSCGTRSEVRKRLNRDATVWLNNTTALEV
jgi:hypothetical protein